MQNEQPLSLNWASLPATTVPLFGQTRQSTSFTPSIPPIGDAPGVENRNFNLGSRQASAASDADLYNPARRLYHDSKFVCHNTLVHSFDTFPESHPLPLVGINFNEPHIQIHTGVGDSELLLHANSTSSPRSETFLWTSSLHAKTASDLHPLHSNRSHIRSLTNSSNVDLAIMTTVAGAPGSPPQLSESRSSKSSSYGSQLSSPDDLASGITNFEEIGLEDDKVRDTEPATFARRTNERKDVGGAYKNKAQRPSLSALQTQPKPYLRSVESGVKSAGIGPVKRGFTSPAIVSMRSSEQLFRTRSSSPPTQNYTPRSTSMTGKQPSVPPLAPHRRGSWQPARKSIREIEAEYHESDDELPDDASLFNVPISPFPSGPRSARSSAHGSPEREVNVCSPAPFPLDHAKTAPESPPRKSTNSQLLPRHRLTPRSSSANLSKSNPSSPKANFYRTGRAKSWNMAMADLSDEARIIGVKLEHHSETNGLSQDSIFPHRSSVPGAVPLPPIQRGALDFMPISKEKAAILSRTRPSWLPPKNPEEERRHLREYQKMMKASLEAEKRKEEKLKQQRGNKEETQASLNRIWQYFVDPSTDIHNIDRRVYDLCWRGIPSKVRGKVWQRKIGNSLGLTAASYQKATQRAEEAKVKPDEERTDLEEKMVNWFADVERDAETAFPELNVFQRNGPLWQDLVNVCEAYTAYRSDVGYFYGLQLMAAILLLQLPDPTDAFILLANCLNKPLPMAFSTGHLEAVLRTHMKVMSTLEMKFPRLHSYLSASDEFGGLGFTGQELFEPMFRTLFANGLDAERLCRVWDIWVFEGDSHLIRSAVALLGSLQSQIMDIQGDIHLKRRNIQEMLGWGPFNRSRYGYWNLEALGNEEAFVAEINSASRLDLTGF